MTSHELLGPVDSRVLDAVSRGALRNRVHAVNVPGLGGEPAKESVLHDSLHRCEAAGLVRSQRDARGRRYELTASGRRRLRTDRHFRRALLGLFARSIDRLG